MRSFAPFRGVSLVDVIVGSALFLIIFTSLFGILRASVAVSGLAKVKAAATSIATSQIEYIRSLEYDAVGTVGGIPSGTIPQNATTTQAGLVFDVRTYIIYADDPADGVGAADATGITTDYKRVKVAVSYTVDGVTRDVTLVTNAAPPGIESTTGGGTIRVSVVDAVGAAVSGASVRILNVALAPDVDISTFSDSTGTVFLPGAPTSTDYQVFVTKSGYSSAQTYARDATNQNPTPGYLTVAEGQTTTGTFAIDVLALVTVSTFSPIQEDVFFDTFNSSANVQTLSGTALSVGDLVLQGAPPTYTASGYALSTTSAPQSLTRWISASTSASLPAGTSVRLQITDAAGTLLPDTALPNNAFGFITPIDLSSVSTTTYPALALRATLATSDPSVTPSVAYWELGYEAGPVPLPNISFTLTGAKTIGSMIDGTALYKTTVATTTDATGVRTLLLEWDSYDLTLPGFTIVGSDPTPPYEILPSVPVNASLIIEP